MVEVLRLHWEKSWVVKEEEFRSPPSKRLQLKATRCPW